MVNQYSSRRRLCLLEQFSVGLQVTETTAIRLGRTLAPLGIVGPRHEPPLFFGVERPNLEKYIYHLRGQLMVLVWLVIFLKISHMRFMQLQNRWRRY